MNFSLRVRSKEPGEPGLSGHVYRKDTPDIRQQVYGTDARG